MISPSRPLDRLTQGPLTLGVELPLDNDWVRTDRAPPRPSACLTCAPMPS